MEFLLKDDLHQLEKAKAEYLAVKAFDDYNTQVAKTNVKSILSSKEGIMASFGVGFVKGLMDNPDNQKCGSSHSELIKIISLLIK